MHAIPAQNTTYEQGKTNDGYGDAGRTKPPGEPMHALLDVRARTVRRQAEIGLQVGDLPGDRFTRLEVRLFDKRADEVRGSGKEHDRSTGNLGPTRRDPSRLPSDKSLALPGRNSNQGGD